MTPSPVPVGALKGAWSQRFMGLPEWPVPGADVPNDEPGILEALRAAPADALEYVHSNREPGARMAPMDLPRDRAEFVDPEGPFSVVRAGNVAVWCEPVAAWCRRWAEFIGRTVGERAERVHDVRAEIYVTSPHGVTAFHADPSHNFTHQVKGVREIRVFPNRDPRLIDETTRAGVYLHRATYPIYDPRCEDVAQRWRLAPGNGCYIPPLSGHWLQNGDELSISYVISVRTDAEIREKLVHGMNQRLRAVGYHPSTFGAHPRRDAVKARVEGRLRDARRWFARHVQRHPDRAYREPIEV